jgi:benzoyl-CoA reductase/2-hydroxyglutaryl-CoA dehydratase subunit BcrC/BadD/HgdB
MASKDLENQMEYIKSSQDEAGIYSKGIVKLFDLASNYISNGEEACRQGKNAVWTLGWWETPLIYACDTIPLATPEFGRLADKEAVEITENLFQFPSETCSMVLAQLGEFYKHKNGPVKRLIACDNVCEPLNMMSNLLQREGYDVYRIETVYLPPNYTPKKYEQLISYFIAQLYETAEWLTGTKLAEKKLEHEIKRRNEVIKKTRRIMELRLSKPLFLKTLPAMYLSAGLAHDFGKPEEYNEMLDLLIEELESDRDYPGRGQKVVPLVWSGGRTQMFGVYKAIDDLGGAILGLSVPSCCATPLYQEDIPPVESVVRYMLGGPRSGAGVHRRKLVEQQIDFCKARGIIHFGTIGCYQQGVTGETELEYFRKVGIPGLGLEGTFNVGVPSGQLLTRIKAFIEMLS